MSAEPQRTCPKCGSEFSGAMEFCPVCMLRKALHGVWEVWGKNGRRYKYYYRDGFKYWQMGHIINRARAQDPWPAEEVGTSVGWKSSAPALPVTANQGGGDNEN